MSRCLAGNACGVGTNKVIFQKIALAESPPLEKRHGAKNQSPHLQTQKKRNEIVSASVRTTFGEVVCCSFSTPSSQSERCQKERHELNTHTHTQDESTASCSILRRQHKGNISHTPVRFIETRSRGNVTGDDPGPRGDSGSLSLHF